MRRSTNNHPTKRKVIVALWGRKASNAEIAWRSPGSTYGSANGPPSSKRISHQAYTEIARCRLTKIPYSDLDFALSKVGFSSEDRGSAMVLFDSEDAASALASIARQTPDGAVTTESVEVGEVWARV
jgi:hypothetical protein